MHRMFEATTPDGPVFVMRGDGQQRREFTYVSDVVTATVAAGFIGEAANATFDVGGGSSVSLQQVMTLIETLAGAPIRMETVEAPAGAPAITVARTDDTAEILGWSPKIDLVEGLARQYEWHHQRAASEESVLVAD